MKPLAFIAFLLPLTALAQPTTYAGQNSELIIVETNLSSELAYNELIRAAIDQGIEIESHDPVSMTLTTKENNAVSLIDNELWESQFMAHIYAYVKAGTIYLKSPVIDRVEIPVGKGKNKRMEVFETVHAATPAKWSVTWDNMNELAISISKSIHNEDKVMYASLK